VFTQLGIHVVGLPARPDAGGLLEFGVRDERLRVALLPWVARQHAIRALQLMELEGAEAVQHYADRVRHMIDRLCATFRPDAVNVIAAHAYVRGGMGGGGERVTHLIEEYFVTPASFPATASYVALGHLHRRQRIDAGVPVWYCGSPIQVDFGDDSDPRGAIVVEATAGLPPRVEFVALSTPARLATIRGSLAELPSLAAASGADYLRVVVDEPARPGLADEVRAVVPNAVDIGIVPPRRASLEPPSAHDHAHRSPHDLFVDYLDSAGADRDPALLRLFDDLHEEAILP
jgi:exonuclease SbcD